MIGQEMFRKYLWITSNTLNILTFGDKTETYCCRVFKNCKEGRLFWYTQMRVIDYIAYLLSFGRSQSHCYYSFKFKDSSYEKYKRRK